MASASCSIILWGNFAPAPSLPGTRGCLPATPRVGRRLRPPGCQAHMSSSQPQSLAVSRASVAWTHHVAAHPWLAVTCPTFPPTPVRLQSAVRDRFPCVLGASTLLEVHLVPVQISQGWGSVPAGEGWTPFGLTSRSGCR